MLIMTNTCLTAFAFSAFTLLVGWQEGHPARKKIGGWLRWALLSPYGVVPSRIVGVSASVNLSLHHKVQRFSSGTGSPGWSRKKGRKTVVVVVVVFNGLFSRTTWISWQQKGKTILDFNKARDDEVAVASAGLYAIHLHLAADR